MGNMGTDRDPWGWESGIIPKKWTPGEPAAPYGDVPELGQVPPVSPEAGHPKRLLPPKQTPRPALKWKRAPSRRGNGLGGFCLLLTVLLILTGGAVYIQGGVQLPEAPVTRFWREWSWGGFYRYYGDYKEESSWTDELDQTAIIRAPVRNGVTLELLPGEEAQLTPREIYEKVSPSVVGIRATTQDALYLGTGVIMTQDGYIITNAHVIAGTSEASVVFSDNTRAEALLVGYDGETDLAVLKVDREGLPAAEFGDSSQLRVGDPAYAIGNPLGEELWGTMTDGIISAIDRSIDMDGQSMTLLQTTAALNSGNSGGALINAAGQVVGITNMKMMSDWETIEGLGFAVPSRQTKTVVDQLISLGYYTGRPGLGIRVTDHYDENGSPDGAEVVSVKKSSDAAGKLFAGDVIIEAQGRPVTCTEDLLRIKDWYIVGEELELRVWAGGPSPEEGRIILVSVTLCRSSDMADSPDLITGRGKEK